MKKSEILRNIAQGLNELADIIESEGNTTAIPAEKVSKKAEVAPPANVEEKTTSGTLSKESLDAMKYNDLKKLAKEMGVEPNGTREAITERLLGVEVEAPEEDGDDGAEETTVDLQSQVEEAVADLSVEEIAQMLTDVGVSPKGKRQALIAKLVKAVEEGKIEFDGDDEDSGEDEDEDSTDNDDSGEADEEDYFPDDMTDERAEVIEALEKEIRAEYKKKGITDKEVAEACKAFYLDHEGYNSKLPKGEQLDMFVLAMQRMVDDEGEQRDIEEPYEMNGQPACCGHYLKELDSGNLFCEVCSQEYEAD